ncbi:A disintegrin and metalloproteinase with thrombospondin motifs 3-like [Artemia franciscana]|uniref:A disintegrin and metalloproteinase with thrombospondin motifs 3-like n=1 Tax=Artemia franciscana TaxID=6661 RepID=UPI0032DA13DF
MLVIPKGVRNIEVVKIPVEPHILSLRERKGKRWALNNPATVKTKIDKVVYVVSAGARFRYWKEGAKEIIIAKGPTLQELLLMVIPGETANPNSSVTITATWTVPKRKGKQIAEKYLWEIAGWSPCSTSCGGGLQKQVLACRRRSTKKLVKHKFCRAVKKMKVESRQCNVFGCDFRWVVGPWEGCSTTCGPNGVQERQIFCVQTNLRNSTLNNQSSYSFRMKEKFVPLKQKQRDQPFEDGKGFNEEQDYPVEVNVTEKYYIQDPNKCKKEKQPDQLRNCNRISCPGVWVEGGWKKCIGTCEKSTRELRFTCIGVQESEDFYTLSAKATEEAFVSTKEKSEDFDCGIKPKIKQLCDTKCVKPCESDESKFCMIPLLYKYCAIPGIRQRCCQTCSNYVRNT